MIQNFLSRYRPRYVRALVYMLQASEYDVREYLAWLGRTRDFTTVEKRKQLIKTPKALATLALAWFLALGILVAAISKIWTVPAPLNYISFLALLALAPYLLAYGITVPLVIFTLLVQKPLEYFMVSRAKKTLEKHRAVKIAVAGSFGKTSMREILKTVLSEGKKVSAPPHSYNTPLGISAFIQTLKGDEEVLIFELGEGRKGDVRTLCKLVQPDMGIITGINEAHLKKFKTLERTVQTIYELADYLGDKPLYVSGESDLAKKNARAGHILYSRTGVGDSKIENPKTDVGGLSFTLVTGSSRLELSSSLLGLHQVGPLAAAVDLAKRLGLSPEQIRSGIGKTVPFEHRLEPTTDASGVITLDDSYNGNPDGVKAVIDFLASITGHRRFYVTPGLVEMGARTESVHKEIGHWLAQAKIENVILIRNSVTPYIERGLKEAGYRGEVLWFEEALQAFAALPHLTVRGDVVLLQNDWPDQYA
jgi:UDP-N-acetylmuramoyl-tripeptide--D-alanyl-D-alanine ligase